MREKKQEISDKISEKGRKTETRRERKAHREERLRDTERKRKGPREKETGTVYSAHRADLPFFCVFSTVQYWYR